MMSTKKEMIEFLKSQGFSAYTSKQMIKEGDTLESLKESFGEVCKQQEELKINDTFECHRVRKETEKAVLLHINGENKPAKWFPKSHCTVEGSLYFPAAWLLK